MISAPRRVPTARRKRVGRGIGGKGGKTAGRGTKGQGARDTIPMGFEGGQLPLMQRIPKLRGFTNPFRVEYTPVNVGRPRRRRRVTRPTSPPWWLAGLAHKGDLVKVLGGGELTRALRVEAHAFSTSAEAAITGAGGSVVDRPAAVRQRPPAGQGQRPHQPLASSERGVEESHACQLGQHLPHPRSSQEGPLHADHHRPVPVRGERAGPLRELLEGGPARGGVEVVRACSDSSTCSAAAPSPAWPCSGWASCPTSPRASSSSSWRR